MTTVQFENFRIELSQPLDNRPDVVLIKATDGRIAILGDGLLADGLDPFSADEYRQMGSQPHKELASQGKI